jgi:hypothetical protein
MIQKIQKLFVGKKKEYFLEVDDAKGSKSPEPSAKSPKKATEPAKVEDQPKVETETEAKGKAKDKGGKKAEKPAKNRQKSANKEASKSQKAPEADPTPVAVSTQSNGKAEPKSVEFATKYLIVPTGSRRRPGPSLNTFKTMAREVKVPRS